MSCDSIEQNYFSSTNYNFYTTTRMAILKPQSEFGHAPPPQTNYSFITNAPGWDLLRRVRDGDMEPLSRIVHIYPRLGPTFAIQEVRSSVQPPVDSVVIRVRLFTQSCSS
jgi:hypothetical protein